MADGYPGYQYLLERIAGIRQCCQHVIRRCRAVAGLGPGNLQSWAEEISLSCARRTPPWTAPGRAATPAWTRKSSMS